MTQRCTTCDHPKVSEINAGLVGAATAKRRIAAQYGLQESSLRRHEESHIPELLAEASAAARTASADALLVQLRRRIERSTLILDKAESLFRRADESEDIELALKALDQLRKTNADFDGGLKLLGEVTGEMAPSKLELTGRNGGAIAVTATEADQTALLAIVFDEVGGLEGGVEAMGRVLRRLRGEAGREVVEAPSPALVQGGNVDNAERKGIDDDESEDEDDQQAIQQASQAADDGQ